MADQSQSSLEEAASRSQSKAEEVEVLAQEEARPAAPLVAVAQRAYALGYLKHHNCPSLRTRKQVWPLMRFSVEQDDPVAFLEAQGALHGLFDQLYIRRDHLTHRHQLEIEAWTERFAADVPTEGVLRALNAKTRDEAKAAILLVLHATLRQFGDLEKDLRTIVASSHADAMAEGTVSAGAIMQQRGGKKVPNLTDLHKKTLSALQQGSAYWHGTNSTTDAILGALAGDVAIHQGAQAAQGSDEKTLSHGVFVTIAAGVGAALLLDEAMHTFYAGSQLDYYTKAQQKVDFVTVGDGRVCIECLDAEDGSPYNPDEAPPIPLHFGCRCWYAAAS